MNNKLRNNETEEQIIPLEESMQVSDLGCAAALATAGFELVALDRQNPRKIVFVFRRKTDILKVADEYWADHLKIKARAFFDNIKMLKNRIYSE